MNVQKKNLVRVLRYMADEIEMHEPERIKAEDITTDWNGPRIVKVDLPIGVRGLFRLQASYPNQED